MKPKEKKPETVFRIIDKERKFDIDTIKGATAYLESEGFDVDECVKNGMKVINSIKDKLNIKPSVNTD